MQNPARSFARISFILPIIYWVFAVPLWMIFFMLNFSKTGDPPSYYYITFGILSVLPFAGMVFGAKALKEITKSSMTSGRLTAVVGSIHSTVAFLLPLSSVLDIGYEHLIVWPLSLVVAIMVLSKAYGRK